MTFLWTFDYHRVVTVEIYFRVYLHIFGWNILWISVQCLYFLLQDGVLDIPIERVETTKVNTEVIIHTFL